MFGVRTGYMGRDGRGGEFVLGGGWRAGVCLRVCGWRFEESHHDLGVE